MKKRIAVFLSLLLLCTACFAFAEEDAEAMIERGFQAVEAGDGATAMDLFSKATDLGSARGLHAIGYLYDLGYGVEQSDEKAIESATTLIQILRDYGAKHTEAWHCSNPSPNGPARRTILRF